MFQTTKAHLKYLFWIPKCHKHLYTQRTITVSSKFSTKHLSLLLTKILTAVKEKFRVLCNSLFKKRCKSDVDSLKIFEITKLYKNQEHQNLGP